MSRVSKYRTTESATESGGKIWRAGLYIRLSREDGDKIESESISSQKAILERFVDENPSVSLYDRYIDDGWSGTDFDRPAFRRMMADVTTKKINCVIVKDLSRFGRNYVEAGKYLETVFPLFNIRFIAVNDRIDNIADPQSMNNVIVPFKNIMNDEYCRDISLKVRSALDIRRRQGKFIGSFAAYGYKKSEADHGKLVIDEEAAAIVRGIYDKFLSGYSILGIARELNENGVPNPNAYKVSKGLKCNAAQSRFWSDSTVRRILTNELYIGNLVQKKNELISHKIHISKPVDVKNRIKVTGTHEPVVAESDFYKVQSLLTRDTRVSPSEKKLSVFSGFVKCADCGRAMQKRTVRQPYGTYDYYVCSTYKKMRKCACSKHSVRVDSLEKTVLAFLNKYISFAVDFDRLRERINAELKSGTRSSELEAEIKSNERESAKAKRLLLELYPDFKSGIIDREQYFALKEKFENTVNRASDNINRLREELTALQNGIAEGGELISALKKYRGLKKLTRDVVTELIDNIYVHADGTVEIRLKFKAASLKIEEYISLVGESLNPADGFYKSSNLDMSTAAISPLKS